MAAEQGNNRHGFARDVTVNVVANLVAAAVIYILAVVGGHLRANGLILSWAITIAWTAAGVGLIVALEEMSYRRRWRWWSFGKALGVYLAATIVVLLLIDLRLW
ncbi:hypothetical protein I0C86_11050 [Plantactinospora sp. S1510]|uniref:Uncharacterized protein n=1 Tax=Plantactinospora alkalitolerans TaxID=2789879 RepID=A0ABS0GTI2_9ACTN|nr:hypothetical protein [Plantactinospora alkalitolerans]MBF9129499.1 hypothetical protein [Plantactinospora alkalitolerans]